MRFRGLCNLKLLNPFVFGSVAQGWNRENKECRYSEGALEPLNSKILESMQKPSSIKGIDASQRPEEVLNNPYPTSGAWK